MSPSSPSSRSNREFSGPIRLAISTCPNDTFAFHAILEKTIDLQGLEFDIQLLDIQQLNEGVLEGRFDVAKASFYAAARLSDQVLVLPSGSALGFGVGPLLLASNSKTTPGANITQAPSIDSNDAVDGTLTLCPGQSTTAAMLFQIFYREAIELGQTRVEHRLFSEIMPSLIAKRSDFGVCIHEGRFTWEQEGLFLVEDLGTRWELETQTPLPLGGILVRRDLDHDLIQRIASVIRSSVEYGLAHRDETLPTMRRHAQELNDEVLFSHVDLYVNDWTIELGDAGGEALRVLSERARDCGLIPQETPDIQIWCR